jgi:DNA-binding beta-propeller fold protein YncE
MTAEVKRPIHRLLCCTWTILLLTVVAAPAHADEGFADVQHNLFVTGRDSAVVAVVAIESDKVVGRLDLGLVPRKMLVSESLAKLVAIDGQTARVAVTELVTLHPQILSFDFVPHRLLISPDGLTLLVADDESGAIVLIDLMLVREKARIKGPTKIRDAIFSGDSRFAFTVAEGLRGIGVIDITTGRVAQTLETSASVALARSPNGREGFALAAGFPGDVIHLDLKTPAVLDRLPTQGGSGLSLTGTGRYLMLPDKHSRTLSFAATQPLQPAIALKGGQDISAIYSAWFDSVAFAPNPSDHTVLVYDLEKLAAAGLISLDGAPGAGAVSPDGATLFLPVAETEKLAVIDARSRRLTTTIPLGFPPAAAVMAGGYGICH